MTVHALAGLTVLNLLFLVSGAALLWLLRGWNTWIEVARFAGLAYVTGAVVASSLWTLLLIAGVPFSLWLVVSVPVVVTLVTTRGARRGGRRRPRRASRGLGRSLYITAAGIAAAGLLLEAYFRPSRLSGLYEWDAWSFWIPKAQAIYFFGELDVELLRSLPGSSYPPLVPVLDAAAFHLMGGADVVTLHVQYWLLGVGFIWALAGLLAERVPPWILWPFVLLALVAPRLGRRFQTVEADFLLQYLFVLAALLVLLWILDRARWRLIVATILMCGMVLTKREGLLLAAVLVGAALLASAREWRSAWPALGVVVLVVAMIAAPWRIWYIAHGIAAESPTSGGLDPTEHAARLWPSLKLALDVLFSSDYWSVLVAVAVGALILAALLRAYTLTVFFGALLILVTLGGGWITWAIPELPITQELGGNPIVRFMGAAALLCVAAAPMLLAATWSAVHSRPGSGAVGTGKAWLVALIAALPLLGYPLVALAGGAPRFPSADKCLGAAVEGRPVDLVFGRFATRGEAEAFQERILSVGFPGTEVLFDGCGRRWEVVLEDIPSVEIAREVQAEAATVELSPTLELASPG